MVESGSLLRSYAGSPRIEGSNPSLSATFTYTPTFIHPAHVSRPTHTRRAIASADRVLRPNDRP